MWIDGEIGRKGFNAKRVKCRDKMRITRIRKCTLQRAIKVLVVVRASLGLEGRVNEKVRDCRRRFLGLPSLLMIQVLSTGVGIRVASLVCSSIG